MFREESVFSLQQLQRKLKEFRKKIPFFALKKNFSDLDRPSTIRNEENVEPVKTVKQEDNSISLSFMLGLHEGTLHRILTHYLGKKSLCKDGCLTNVRNVDI